MENSVPVKPKQNLIDKGLVLPIVEDPAFNYAPLSIHQDVVYLAGQLAKENGTVAETGRVMIDVSEPEAARQMQLCALQSLARLQSALGTLDDVTAILHMNAYVACDHEYPGMSRLADHASAVFITAYGEAGRHPRSVLGMTRLPQNAPVMIDLRVAIARP